MKTITIDDDAYELLSSLKLEKGDSFTKVILRHVRKPCDTAGELLDFYAGKPPPDIDWGVLDKIAAGRRRRSGGRK